MIVLDEWWRIGWSLRSLIAKRVESKKWVIYGAWFRVRKFLLLGKKRGEWNAKGGWRGLWLVSGRAKLGGIFTFLHGFEFGVGVWVDINFIYERNKNSIKWEENSFGFGLFFLLVISWGEKLRIFTGKKKNYEVEMVRVTETGTEEKKKEGEREGQEEEEDK